MRTKIVSSLLRVLIEENALASHGLVSDCCFTRDVRSSIDFNRALQSVVGSVAIGLARPILETVFSSIQPLPTN